MSAAPPDLRNKALRLLSQREHSRAELRRKLSGGDAAAETVEALLDDFEARGWQSDRRFAVAYVDAHLGRYGRYRLEQALRERGIDAATIAEALEQRDPDAGDELQRAQALWRKKFGRPPADAQERARQARFLQSRGFGFEIIRRVIAGLDDE
ncbi:recombination regulator RecX [Chitinimonas koreensis]|uniref:recombination regulator RecX n=1 Tax=Chitinimonas koreensis TaxID=356302 RepID=UPI000418D93F|nr:recombination regulator RecX [Chitinimonas koreensis]QNM95036.1 recombination regulator RecX [Chitinimonas koreensis]